MLSAIDSLAAKIYGMGHVRIETGLSSEEVSKRINRAIDDRPFLGDGLVGRATDDAVVVSRKRPLMKVPFKPVLRATIESTGDGAAIVGEFTLSRMSMIGALPFTLLMGSVGIAIALGEAEAGRVSAALF